NWCRVLMSKRRVLVLAEMLCLIAVASMSLFVSPLAYAHVEKGGGGVKNVALQPATFQSIVTTIVKSPSSGAIASTTIQMSNHMALKDLKNDPWVIVTLSV